jgi:hypothetical protein
MGEYIRVGMSFQPKIELHTYTAKNERTPTDQPVDVVPEPDSEQLVALTLKNHRSKRSRFGIGSKTRSFSIGSLFRSTTGMID